MKVTKFCEEGSRAAGLGHLGLFSKTAHTGRVSGLGDTEMDRVGKTMKLCVSLSTVNTVPETVILAGILQAPTGLLGDTARGLNCKLKTVRTTSKVKLKEITYVHDVTHQLAVRLVLRTIFYIIELAVCNHLRQT